MLGHRTLPGTAFSSFNGATLTHEMYADFSAPCTAPSSVP